MKIPAQILARQREITTNFQRHIAAHLQDIVSGKATEMFEIRDIAALMFLHPTHLSNTIKLVTGKAPCYFFETQIMDIARNMLQDSSRSISSIAVQLTYDPSNFTKFFKHFEGCTPKQYREAWLARQQKTETVTI